jgi:hypothetical protein
MDIGCYPFDLLFFFPFSGLSVELWTPFLFRLQFLALTALILLKPVTLILGGIYPTHFDKVSLHLWGAFLTPLVHG